MWHQLIIKASRALAPRISDAMHELGAVSVSLSDTEDEPVFDRLDGESPLWSRTTVSGLWKEESDPDLVIDALRDWLAPNELPAVEKRTLEDQDWERVWLDRFEPIKINDRLWISPVHISPPAPALPTVYVDPGLAFGTGTHATTHLCLKWLTQIELQGLDVIDYGCGSGILAIAALKLGARHAIGVDTDPRAVDVSRVNAHQNDVDHVFSAYLPEELPIASTAQVVLANILAEPLVELAPAITELVAPGGQLALSGMLAEQAEDVKKHYSANFELHCELRDGWVLLAGRKKD
jgi:ribosomal protein L11 methyltransferase